MINLLVSIIHWILGYQSQPKKAEGVQSPLKATKESQRGLKMAADGYGWGNLPMDLYKMVIHDNWAPTGERADGQGDYTPWGINKIKILYRENDWNGRDIVSPDGFVHHITKGQGVLESHDGDTVTYSDGGFYWQIDGSQEPCDICNEMGGYDWEYYQ